MGVAPPTLLPSESIVKTFYVDEPLVGALGGLPVAEQTQDYFVVFRQVGGTGPEIIGQTAYFITYLVDSDGNVSKPAEDEDALNNLIQNFPVGKNCIVRQDAASVLNSILSGKKQVTAIGKQLPILYTQTGFYTGSYSTAVSFSFQDASSNATFDTLYDYRGLMRKNNPATLSIGTITGYTTIDQAPNAGVATFNTTNGTYTIVPDDNLLSLTFEISFKLTNSTFNSRTANFSLEVNRDGTYTNLLTKTVEVPGMEQQDEYGGYYDTEEGSTIETATYTAVGGALLNDGNNPIFRFKSNTSDSNLTLEWINFNVKNMNPQPGIVESGGDDFWATGPASPNGQWLTASSFLSINYDNTQVSSYITDQAVDGYNLSPIISPFKPRIGDRIRFEYNKEKEYYIYEVIAPCKDPDGRLKMRINNFVPTNTEFNNFILHRTDVNTPSYIILDVDKDDSVEDTQNFNGLLLPEYPSEKLKKNLDSLILTLKEKGIIVDVQT